MPTPARNLSTDENVQNLDTLFSSFFSRHVRATSMTQRRVENTRVHFGVNSPVSVEKDKNTISSTQYYYRKKPSNSNFTHNNYTNVTLSSYRIFARVLRQNVDCVPIPAEVSQFRQPKSANKYMGSYNDWLEIGDHY